MTEPEDNWLKLRGGTAVVTGAAGGIGAAIALELARNGMRVAVLDLQEDKAAAVADEAAELGVDAVGMAIDTSDPDAVTTVSNRVLERFGEVDVLINNAGIVRPGPLADISLADWQRVIDVNLTGYLLCAQTFGAAMRTRGRGSIVHVSSICASNPQPNSGAYSPSKAAVSMLSRTLALEWAGSGVRSNVLSPGMIRTPMTETIYLDQRVVDARNAAIPLGRVGTPQDLADCAAWLASTRSAYVTGQDIIVDGGFDQSLLTHVPLPAKD
ncbi:2-deoxy-D-gluconate 3-dehydrogenase [Rhodococcus sp. 14-2496-1d]|uniref:SDR family NAD(P)-dependent oxidoreductase n=1 Tax=Rhodococcus sp. 14-2496-1d TaxID=2023146 RepID=UPI000B9C1D6F|nr:SDR family oxidoreductase [Rhodococcus sp. 14-2496-1d]OZF25691.1 2-deoxy-D-gluconate 3-dehydrogenase [Rhodococcus sp. 14-2496-1d]